jgi:aspartate aminotransferase-like enzyme
MQSLSCAILHSAFASERAPVEVVGMMNETKEGLKTIFKTENELTMPVSAPGSAGMETCFANLFKDIFVKLLTVK